MRPFNPREEAHLLSAYVDGELDQENVARIEAHLAENEESRLEVERLRHFNKVAGSLRLKQPPPEQWEDFWLRFPHRAERHLGWLMLTIGVLVVGLWGLFELGKALVGAGVPMYMKAGVFMGAMGLLVLLISVIRERIHTRARTRYKDVIR